MVIPKGFTGLLDTILPTRASRYSNMYTSMVLESLERVIPKGFE
jgi:hypothetical protein